MKIIKLIGKFHRKQVDLVNLASLYDEIKFVLPSYRGRFDFSLPTEVEDIGDFQTSSFLKSLDDKLLFKQFCSKNKLKTLFWSSSVITKPGEYLLKPRVSSGSVGIISKRLEINNKIPIGFIAEQKLIDFETFGAGIYAFKGSIRNRITWKRVKTFPKKGGPSSVAKIVSCSEIDKLVDKFIEKINIFDLHGFFMLEFIKSNDEIFFLEINPRIWGSIALLEIGTENLISNFVGDNLDEKISKSLKVNKRFNFFVNPLLAPSELFKGGKNFYSGFTYGGLRGFKYLLNFFTFTNIKKLFYKLTS